MKMENNKEELLFLSCYDEDGYLSFMKIATVFDMNPEKLRDSLNDYIFSFNQDELRFAHQFHYSLEAHKMRNIQILKHRVKGFSKELVSKLYFNESLLKRIEYQLLESIPSIYGNYVNTVDNKTQTI